MHLPRLILLAALLPGAATCANAATQTGHLQLKQAAQWTPAPVQSGRYQLRARFAVQESAGSLRENGQISLIGRFAKLGQSCDAAGIFGNGFEGN